MYYFNISILFFRDLSFYSRKGIDFSIWSLVLYIFILGYHNVPKGRKLLLKLSNNMNSKRYFSDLSAFIEEDEIKTLFRTNPPFDLFSSQVEKVTSFWLKNILYLKEAEKGLKYTFGAKNGVEINGSPFDSFRSGGKAINLNSVSSIKNYLDTGKVFKEEYTFLFQFSV